MGSSDFGILVSIQKNFFQLQGHYIQTFFVQSWFGPRYRTLQILCVKSLLRSLIFPDGVILNAQHPRVRSFCSGHINFRSDTSAWLIFQLSDMSVAWLNLQSIMLKPNININIWSASESNSEKHTKSNWIEWIKKKIAPIKKRRFSELENARTSSSSFF